MSGRVAQRFVQHLWTTLFVVACTSPGAPSPTLARLTAEDYVRIYGGLAGVYRSIIDETDCATLQDDFYTATENKTLGYQAAISDRARIIGCPELRFTR